MGFEIIEGRNDGYPCIPELRECESTALTYPVSEFMFTPGESGYPEIARLPEAETGFTGEQPEYIMMCFGEQVNGGYPWISGLKTAVRASYSYLYFGDRHAEKLYYEGKEIETAYCGGRKVFDTYLIREKIV